MQFAAVVGVNVAGVSWGGAEGASAGPRSFDKLWTREKADHFVGFLYVAFVPTHAARRDVSAISRLS